MDIIEKVKNTILEWTLKLEEEGVLGEGMRFSDKEKQTAKALSQTVNNYYGATNVINAPSKGMQIVSGNEHVTFSYDQARAAISKIEAAISQEQLKSEDKDAALEMLTEIPDKHTRFVLKRKRPHGISPHAVIFFAESPSALPRLLAADVEPEMFDLRAFDLTSHM